MIWNSRNHRLSGISARNAQTSPQSAYCTAQMIPEQILNELHQLREWNPTIAVPDLKEPSRYLSGPTGLEFVPSTEHLNDSGYFSSSDNETINRDLFFFWIISRTTIVIMIHLPVLFFLNPKSRLLLCMFLLPHYSQIVRLASLLLLVMIVSKKVKLHK